jgi:hypothetical protein
MYFYIYITQRVKLHYHQWKDVREPCYSSNAVLSDTDYDFKRMCLPVTLEMKNIFKRNGTT